MIKQYLLYDFGEFKMALQSNLAEGRKARSDCFITTSISKEMVPEMVALSVLQHQMPKFRIKHGKFHKEIIHIDLPSLHRSTSLSVLIEDFHL